MTNNQTSPYIPNGRLTLNATGSGILNGLTFAAKELIDITGHITGCGNPYWLHERNPAQQSAPCIERLLSKGATFAGRTISDEMAFSLDGNNVHYGTPLNPKAPERIPGGSSCGSASIVAQAKVDFALGTDTAGSVRIPAAYCGLYGFRPSHGKVPLQGVHPMATSFDVVGIFSRSVDTMNKVAGTLLDESIGSNKVGKVYIFAEYFNHLEPSVKNRYDRALQRIQDNGIELVELSADWLDIPLWIDTLRHIQWWELYQAHGRWIDDNIDTFGLEIKGRLQQIATVSEQDYRKYQGIRRVLTDKINDVLGPEKLVLLPTASDVAPLKNCTIEQFRAFRMRLMQHVCLATVAGLPQVNIPLDDNQGAPLGLSLMAAGGQDSRLLSALSVLG